MRRYFINGFLICITLISGQGQSNMDTVLAYISKNNKTIRANAQYWEAQKQQYKTGLNPDDPELTYDYLIGSPAAAGNQTEIILTQSFDFPTVYKKRRQVADQQIAQTEFQLISARQSLLLEAKKHCIELVFRNKLNSQLLKRKQTTEKLLSDFQIKLNKGDGTILEVNKAQLQLIEVNREYQQNLSIIKQLNEKLTELNGGNAIQFTDTIYFQQSDIPAFEQLEKDFEANDPVLKILEQELLIAQKQIELSRAMTFPKLEAGYRYQGNSGQDFHGFHLGLSIPLWENKNKVQMQQANLLYNELELQHHLNEHYYEIKQLYEKYANHKTTLEQYQNTFATFNNTALLDKSLALGQISTIEYFMELSYYTNAFNNYLQLEKVYYETIAELTKYKL